MVATLVAATLSTTMLISNDPETALAASSPGATLRIGSEVLTHCPFSSAWCGTLPVPLDRSLPGSPVISMSFHWYPAAAGAASAEGTVVPVEGGPGYSSIGSVDGGYRPMYGPLLTHWNMLVMDLRGTGSSTPLDCARLQGFSGHLSGEAFNSVVGSCGEALDHRWKAASGSWIHASNLFTSAPAAEDLAAVVRALDLSKVDIYGDSYGSWFAQVFASRFPELTRSVVLDSTYATVGLDPWYRSSVDSMPADFDAVCSRSIACSTAASGPSWERLGALAARLRESAVSATVPGPTGRLEPVTMDVIGLVDLINDAAGDPLVYRDLDASARALLDDGDPAPLLRLYAQRLAFDESYAGVASRQYSGSLYFAVSCLDYPQLFDMSASTAVRLQQLAAAEAARPSGTFRPFSTAEWLAQDQYTEAYTACTAWPSPSGNTQPPVVAPAPLLPPSLPVLILGGELDTWTPPAGVPQVESQIGGHSRFVELANATHVVGEDDTSCGSSLVRSFVIDPGAIDSLDASCASTVPPIHAVGNYADSLGQIPLLSEAEPGSPVSVTDSELAVGAVETAGDAVSRLGALGVAVDSGLHGGSAAAGSEGALILDGDQLVPGIAVSGTVDPSPDPGSARRYVADLTVATGNHHLHVTAVWSRAEELATVTASGDGTAFSGTTPAP